MNIVRMILKEAGGRAENAAGAINSKDNMFAGSSGNAMSDKLGGGENNNPIQDTNEGTENAETIDTSATETTATQMPEADTTTDTDTETFSDENLKTYQNYKKENPSDLQTMKGKLKNLDLNPTSQKSVTSNGSGGGGMGAMSNMFSGIMGASGGGAEGGADMGADMGDMGDMADAASDERLKNIFGDNEDAIKCFAHTLCVFYLLVCLFFHLVLGWPKSLFRYFCMVVRKSWNEPFG